MVASHRSRSICSDRSDELRDIGLGICPFAAISSIGFGALLGGAVRYRIYLAFVVIYTAALSLGVLSHMPSGIGVFDAAVLYAVGTQGSPSAVAAALVTYRTIYFQLPFAIAAVLLAASELRRFLRQRRSASGGNGRTTSPRFPIAAPGSDR
jgi:uncharacterized membrane protein YccC